MTDEELARAYGVGVKASTKRDGDTDQEVRCWRCGRLLAELVSRPWRIKCSRCKARNEGKAGFHRATVASD